MTRSSIILRPGASAPLVSFGNQNAASQQQSNLLSPVGGITLVIQAIVEILSDANDYEEGLKGLMKLAGFTGKLGSNKSTGSRGSIVGSNGNQATSAHAIVRPFPMIATCAFYLLPEVRKMFVDYADDIIQEVSSQVQQDTWSTIATAYLEITPNGGGGETTMNSSGGDVTDVSPSYIWMVTAMNHLLSEIVVLLNKETIAGSYGPDARSMALLTRLEVSEVRVDEVIMNDFVVEKVSKC
jgi:hypothetical protein